MDTAWIWEPSSYWAKYSFLTEPKGLTMWEVERIFQLDPEPPVRENLNEYIFKAVQSRKLRWFSFFLHHYENRLNGRIRRFLLREGLDLPEVGLVAILDADKEGFLRSETSLIQTIGRAARNAEARVILYADTITPSMARAMEETERRRGIQMAYNREHGIVPKTIIKEVADTLMISHKAESPVFEEDMGKRKERIALLQQQMQQAARELEFEQAAKLRDEIKRLSGEEVAPSRKIRPGMIGSQKRSRGRTRK